MQILTSYSYHESNLNIVVSASDIEVALMSVELLNVTAFVLELLKVNLLDINDSNMALYELLDVYG